MITSDNLTLKEIKYVMNDPEMAYASMEFWSLFEAQKDENGEIKETTWDNLWAFQVGWMKCKQFYEKEQNERSSFRTDTEERPGI